MVDNNWDKDHTDKNGIFRNNGKSSPVIIHAECRVKYFDSKKLDYYDCIKGLSCGVPFRITIHNYESEALGFDPTIKSEQNYYCFLHLSTLINLPWGLEVKFRDDDGVMFGTADIIRLLEERTEAVMKKWKEDNVEFKKEQDKVLDKIYENNVNIADNDDNAMII